MTSPAKKLDPATRAFFKRARANLAKALAHPQVKAALRAQREGIERERGMRKLYVTILPDRHNILIEGTLRDSANEGPLALETKLREALGDRALVAVCETPPPHQTTSVKGL